MPKFGTIRAMQPFDRAPLATAGNRLQDAVYFSLDVTPVRHFSALGVRCIITLPKIRMIFLSTNIA
jgi:hypothetical protein